MVEGTRFSKLDDAVKSLNDFRKETENQIRDLNNIITRFMHAVDQRLEERNVDATCLEEWQLPLHLVIQSIIVFHIDQ